MAQATMGMLRTVQKEEEKKKAAAPTTTATKKVTIPRSVAPVATSDAGIADVAWKPVDLPQEEPKMVDIPQFGQQPVYTGLSVAQLNQMLAQQQERARIAELERARQASLSALQAEEATIEPQFAEARRQTRATSARGAQQFADFLAARGLTAGGGAALGETRRLGAMQGALGGLAQQETAALGDIARRRTGIETGFESDVAAARAGIQASALERQIEQARLDEANRIQAQQQGFANALELARFTEGVRQYDQGFDFQTRQFEAQNDLDVRRQTFAESQALVENAIRRGQLSVQQGNLLLNKKRFEAQQDPNSLDNQLLQANIADVQARTAGRLADVTEPSLKPTAYKTDPDYAEDLATIVNATPDQKAELLREIQSKAQALITKYGVDGYNALIAEAQTYQLEE